VMTSQIR